MNNQRLRVLIVDDSAFARKIIREVLSQDSELEVVGIARDGLDALEKISELKPDVVTLDLIMPDLDGLGVLRALPKDCPSRVVIVSVSKSDSELALDALEVGAVELVTKPTALATDRLFELSEELILKVKAAGASTLRRFKPPLSDPLRLPLVPAARPGLTKLVAIGTSTGGPQALTQIFKSLPSGLPVPLVVSLHIPPGYTAPLAARISKESAVKMEEAHDGMELRNGEAVIAPGGMHLRIRAQDHRFFAVVSREPSHSLYHPSVDELFRSAAEASGPGALALILTGMGSDGLEGARAVRHGGGRVIAESASSCVVYGMPRVVIEAGIADAAAPLESIPRLLLDFIYRVD